MARDVESFKSLRDSLSTSLRQEARIPIFTDERNVTSKKNEQRFFPAGTATKILTTSKLERLFTQVTAAAPAVKVQPRWLAQEAERRELHVFLAVLIISNCDLDVLVSFTRKVVARSTVEDDLSNLPIEDPVYLKAILGDDEVAADDFHRHQYDFLAPVIEKNKEIKGDFQRLPFLSERLIGEGSFGKIYKVVISPNHFRFDSSSINDRELTLARKDFVLDADSHAHENERKVLLDIVRNAKKNVNIMEGWGSLEFGSTYSLFMPLAICDLQQYMERHSKPPRLPKEKAVFVERAIGLAGAIVFLHEELESPVYERLSCFHMDLKPQNILVVNDEETGRQLWKLSDFNMSRVKVKRKPTGEPSPLRKSATLSDNVEINKLFKRRLPEASNASITESTINRRGTGTYLAPEAYIKDHAVHAESDTWSLGCVVSVVFTYLHGGYAAVEEFANYRLNRSRDRTDRFFTFSGSKEPRKPSDAYLNDGVKRWLRELRTAQRKDAERFLYEDVTRFLESYVFVINPLRRKDTKARHVRAKLVDAFNAYRAMSNDTISPPTSPGSRPGMFGFLTNRKRPKSDISSRPIDLDTSVGTSVRTCVLGPNAHPLVCVTDRELSVYSVHHVSTEEDMDNLLAFGPVCPGEGRSWSRNIGVSAQCVVAATDHHKFECYFYRISQPGSPSSDLETVAHWMFSLPKVARLAISPDSQHAAFILQIETDSGVVASLYIARLDFARSRGDSVVSSSSASSSDPDNPLGRAIPLSCLAEDVCELTFSRSNSLYVVSKPRHVRQVAENAMTVFIWSLQNGRRVALPPTKIEHAGKDDLFQGLFTSFASYNWTTAFAIASQKNTIITRTWTATPFHQSSARGYHILHFLVDLDDRTLLAFGVNQTNNLLHLLAITGTNTQEEASIKTLAILPGVTRQNIASAAVTALSPGDQSRRCVLITTVDNGSVRLFRTPLDPT